MAELIECIVCGTRYSPEESQASCPSCPIQSGCTLTCCPNCGASNIDPSESRLARWLRKILQGGANAVPPAQTSTKP